MVKSSAKNKDDWEQLDTSDFNILICLINFTDKNQKLELAKSCNLAIDLSDS
jgi:hypothetical protein